MRRIVAASVAALALIACVSADQAASAQTANYQISAATPTSTPSGSGDTAITITGTQPSRVVSSYNICFYTGTTSATIVPSSSNTGSATSNFTFTFTVPGVRFQTSGAAASPKISLAVGGTSNPTGCTGAASTISNTFTYSTTATAYAFRTATPSTLPSGSPDTSITLTGIFPTFPTNTSGLGLCFYNGTNSSPILPSNQANTSNVTFLVPSATFTNPASAKLYLASATSTCTGTNPGYGGTFAYAITQGERFNIQSSYPTSLPAGGGNVNVSLYGNLIGSGIPANTGVCFYTGPNTVPTPITPAVFTTTEIDFTVPAADLQIATSNFSSGVYNAQVQLGSTSSSCTATAQGISNVYSFAVSYPTVTSASAAVLPQINANATYTYTPTNIELFGTNFGSKFSGRFIPAGGTQSETTGFQVDQYDATVQLIRPTANTATTAVYGCNYSQGNVYEYCSTTPLSVPNYALASSTTQIASIPASPAPSQPATLTATVTPGPGSTTAGGIFVPGPPTGTVAFADNGSSLGSRPLTAGSLSFSSTGTQQIDIYAGTDAEPNPISGQSRRSQTVAAGARRPNETPNPDVNSQFSSLMADFNKDGINDTLVIQTNTGILHLFLGGSPLGTLQSEQTIYPGVNFSCTSLAGVTVADFNGDGFPDLAYLCGDSGGESSLQISLNQGDGTFLSTGTSLGEVIGNQLAAADVNKDGKVDLVLTGNTGTFCCTGQTFGIQVFTGNGDGTFATGTLTTTADVPGTQIVLKDLNNDGVPDLTLLHYNATTGKTEVALYQNDGTGRFTALTSLPVCTCQVTNSKLFVTPLTTSSPYPDIVVDYAEASSVLAFLNKKTAAIGFTTVAPALYSNLLDAVLGDFNGDGFADLAFYNGSTITIEVGNGTGAFALISPAFAPYTVGTGTANAISLATAPDLNGDGYADLTAIFPTATSSPATSAIASYVTTGTATATLPPATFTSGPHTVTTTYTGNSDVLGSNGSLPLVVGRTTPTVTWSPAATTNTTTALSGAILNATASVPGSFAYSPAVSSFLAAGTQTLTAVFTPTDTNTYSTVTTTRSILVNKTTPTISTIINPGNHTYTPNLATTYTVFVTGSNFVPTGQVQFNNNGSALAAPVAITPGSGYQSGSYITFSSLPAGNFAFTAVYAGDATYNAVTSTVTNYTVSQSTPTLTYAPNPASITYGAGLVASQLTATAVDPNTGASVPGAVTYSTPTLTNLQTGSILPAGANTITAAFAPADNTDYATISKVATINVIAASTTTFVSINPAPIALGASTTLTASVNPTGSGPAVTGQVTFADSNGTIPNAQVTLSNGIANLSYTPTTSGTHAISASYAGSANYTASSTTTPASLVVTQKTPKLTYAPAPTSIAYGTALVASQLNAAAVDPITSATIPGVFTYATPTIPVVQIGTILPTGSNVLTAKFTPTDTTTYTTVGQGASITVTPAVTTTTVTVSSSVINSGQPVLLSATVTPNPNSTIPTGTVVFTDSNGGAIPYATLNNGTATVTYGPTAPGLHNISAQYLGTANYAGSSSITPATLSVGQLNAKLTYTPSPITIVYGTGLVASQLNATAIDPSTGATIPGVFSYSSPSISALQVGSVLPAGVNTLTATFIPTDTATYKSGTQTASITVTAVPTTTIISANPTTITLHQATTLTATVTATPSSTSVTGQITFADDNGAIPNAQVTTTNGIAALSYTPTTSGTHHIAATYAGGTNYATSSTIIPATITVGQATPTLTFTPTPTSIPYGTPLIGTQRNAAAVDPITSATIPGVFTYSTPTIPSLQLGTVLPVGANVITAAFAPTDALTYATAFKTATITVTQFTSNIAWATPASIPYGTTLSATQLNAVANDVNGTAIPGTFTYNPAAGTTLPLGTTQDTVTFTPTNTTNFATATATRAITVIAAPTATALTITPGSISLGQSTTLSATVSPTVGTALISGQVTFADSNGTIPPAQVTLSNGVATVIYTPTTNGTHTITAIFPGNANYAGSSTIGTLAVGQGLPVITFAPNPATIPYGTPLSAAQLDAVQTATAVPGAFSYSSPLGTILPVGGNTITATFTPTDQTSYATVTKSAVINVTSSPSSLALAITANNAPVVTVNSGTVVTLTATLTAVSGIPTYGEVDFCDATASSCADLHLLGSAQVTANGTASYRFVPPVGGHSYRAVFLGTRTSVASTSADSRLLVAGTFPTISTFTSVGSTGNFTLSAVVTSSGSTSSSPTGTVSFLDTSNANAPLGSAVLGSPTLTESFLAEQTFATGGTPNYLATGDFNGDGIADIVSADRTSGTLTILLGKGDGTFSQAQSISAGTAPYAVIVGDFNHDGKADLASIDNTNPDVYIQLGNGDGTFSQAAKISIPNVSFALLAITTGDFDHDGLLDLAVSTGSKAVILMGSGDGNFTQVSAAIAIPDLCYNIATGDFDRDGNLDLVTSAHGSKSVSILFGNGDGTFTKIATTPLDQDGDTAAVADFNSDGIPDLAVTEDDGSSSKVIVLIGKGDGTFTSHPVAGSEGGASVIVADFNHDGISDLAIPSTGDLGHVFFGAGDGTFTLGSAITTGYYAGVVAGDFNGDGFPDIASGTYPNNVAIALNTFTSTSTATATGVNPVGGGSHQVIATYPGDITFKPSTSAPVSLTGQVLIPTIAWTPAPLTLGTPLGTPQLNATATGLNGIALPGVFTYTPPAGTFLSAGTQTLAATFTPADLVDYAITPAATAVRVNSLPTAITLTSSRNPSALSQSTTLTAAITPIGGSSTIAITGPVTFFDGTIPLATTQAVNGIATLPISTLPVGTHLLTASYSGDPASNYLVSTTPTALTQVVSIPAATVTLTGTATTQYGQPTTLTAVLSPTGGLTAVPTGTVTFTDGTAILSTVQSINGLATFTSTALSAGPHTFVATYRGDTTNGPATSNLLPETITKATPTLAFPTPASVPVGTPLSATQLAATAVAVTNAPLPGTFTYTPALGTLVSPGPQTLTALFTPTDTTDYTTATITTTLNGTAVTLTALSSSTAALGDPAKTITLTGTGFVTNSVARSNGVPLATTYVNPTTLTAVLPATSFRTIQVLQITVNNPTPQQTTAALPFTVTAPAATIKVNAPTTASAGDQPTIQSGLTTAYPIDINATFSLSFVPISGGIIDPAIQFSTGGATSAFTIPAGQTTNPNLQIQTGTVAGTITVRLTLTASGVDVTPTGLAPLVITVPTVVPTLTSVTLVRSGRQLTVNTFGYSNTRAVSKATFHFTSATGQQIQTPDATIDVSTIFAGWYSQTASTPYGSTFLYAQVFTLDDDATVVGQVTVTLSNGVGASASGSSQ